MKERKTLKNVVAKNKTERKKKKEGKKEMSTGKKWVEKICNK